MFCFYLFGVLFLPVYSVFTRGGHYSISISILSDTGEKLPVSDTDFGKVDIDRYSGIVLFKRQNFVSHLFFYNKQYKIKTVIYKKNH